MTFTEKQLIDRIKELGQIEPRKDWVLLTKKRIFKGQEETSHSVEGILFNLFFRPKLALAGVLSALVVFVLFSVSQNSLPGDPLYAVKKISEQTEGVFVTNRQSAQVQLEMVNRRLAELAKIAESNQVKKLAPALGEYQASLVKAAKDLAKAAATTSDAVDIKGLARQAQKLAETREMLEKTYGIAGLDLGAENDPTKLVVEWLIKDLEKRTLTDKQQELFSRAKEDFEKGDYGSALIKILQLSEFSYPQE